MKDQHVRALGGGLRSVQRGPYMTGHAIDNDLPIPVRVQYVNPDGTRRSLDIGSARNSYTEIAARTRWPGRSMTTGTTAGDVFLVTTTF